MSEKPEESKPKKPRRPAEEVEADYLARAARSKWRPVRAAVEMLYDAGIGLEEAHSACETKVSAARLDELRKVIIAVDGLRTAIHGEIPPEAR